MMTIKKLKSFIAILLLSGYNKWPRQKSVLAKEGGVPKPNGHSDDDQE